ncbi:MAG: dihydropyrimidinase [Chloroflexi bacterium]|nr:dihydropyrimidinase [Chloroflexota bacterium]
MPTLLIINAHIITATDDYTADIFVEGDKIKLIGAGLAMPADRVIDARGSYVIPGGIDCHTHMDLNVGAATSSDDFETGTIAAAHGGTTTIIDFPTQARGKKMRAALDEWMQKAQGKAAIDYAFHMIISDLPDDWLPDMDALVREGITSFKLFTAYPDRLMLDDATIFKAMTRAGENGGFICMHAENGSIIDYLVQKMIAAGKTTPNYHPLSRPHEVEEEAVHRVIALAEMARVPVYIVHVSSHRAMEQIRAARERGLPVYGETCPQYLFLAYEDYADGAWEGARYVCSPPIRERANQTHLWYALAADDLQVVSTDHCPFCMKEGYRGLPKQKELGKENFAKIPNGVPGVENRLHLLYQGGVVERGWSMQRFAQLTSTAPAKLFGLYPRKGTIAVGSDADIVVWDPKRKFTIRAAEHFMRVDYNPYEAMTIDGSPAYVIARGRVIFEGDKFVGKAGAGEFLRRGRYSLV